MKRKNLENVDNRPNKRVKYNNNNDLLDTNLWVSASQIHNYMLDDPILDWIKYHIKLNLQGCKFSKFVTTLFFWFKVDYRFLDSISTNLKEYTVIG